MKKNLGFLIKISTSLIILYICLLQNYVQAQNLTEAQHQALNNHISFINASVKETSNVLTGLKAYYEQVEYVKKNKSASARQFTCASRLPDYEYKQAIQKSTAIEEKGKSLVTKANALWAALEQIDEHCKAIEVYVRLEDYKKDDFGKFEELLNQIEKDFEKVRQKQQELATEANHVYRQLKPFNGNNAYHRVEKEMQAILGKEIAMLQAWSYHFNEKVATGFPMEALVASVNEMEKKNAAYFKSLTLGIEYPASSMIGSFGSAVASMQQVKKDAVDGYTFDARQSDAYFNDVYLDMLNYYNNDMISFYNSFVSSSQQKLLMQPELMPVFKIKKEASQANFSVKPFEDKPGIAFTAKKQSTAISGKNFEALNLHVDFINESVRSVNTLLRQLRFYDIDKSSFEGKNKLNYVHEKFSIPLSFYQSAIHAEAAFPENYGKAIHSQAEVLVNILKEMDGLGIELALHTKAMAYSTDNFGRVSQIRDRYKFLFETFDTRKEQLYADLKKIFNAYPLAQPTSSWNVAGKALLEIVDLDKEVLFAVKDYVKGNTQALPQTDKLESSIRSVIANQYTNMKGIERIGRNNGLCPYNPYEDIPQNSKTLAADAVNIGKKTSSYNQRPYEGFMYKYNGIVYEYNKFAELSKTPILKNINQPDLFLLQQPYREPLSNNTKPETAKNTPGENSRKENPDGKTMVPGNEGKTIVIHDTVRIVDVQKMETFKTDTVFVENLKVDTVYITQEDVNKNFLSMKGYATNNMVLLLDVSSSMAAPQKLPLLKQSVKLLLQILRPEDEIAIVVYSGNAKVVLPSTSAKDANKINKIIDKLQSDGATNGNEGIQLAYKVADKNFKKGGNNRIILASDGEFPVSQEVHDLIANQAAKDIKLSVFNFGNNTTAAKTLQTLAIQGKGQYEHITPDNADVSLIKQAKAKRSSR